ncbi:hypothetical protein GGR58DRAFT_495662 [Xylaria digitata]|nr:hypothetical protein GGR58DRAFT_495662 [Xylaria digitata]
MYRMYLTEHRNERRKYANDEENETNLVTFSVWRVSDNGEPIQTIADQGFRDKSGEPVASASLEISLKDFICQGILYSPEGAFRDPGLDLSSKELCKVIDEFLMESCEEKKDEIQAHGSNKIWEGRSAVSWGSNRRRLTGVLTGYSCQN